MSGAPRGTRNTNAARCHIRCAQGKRHSDRTRVQRSGGCGLLGSAGPNIDPVMATKPGGPAKVAHVTTAAMSLRHLLLHQLDAVRQAGHEVTGISAPGTDSSSLEELGVRHINVPMTRAFAPLSDLVALVRLYRVMRRERFTIVHTHTPKGGLLGQYAALAARVPVRVHTIHGLYLPEHAGPWLRRAFLLLERVTMAFSHHNFSQNPEDVPLAIRERISRADRIELIRNGIDVAEFDPAKYTPDRRDSIRRSLNLGQDHVVVGIVARLVREKGYVELLQAAASMRDRAPYVRFVCVGPVDSEKSDALSPDVAKEHGVGDVVQFLGHRDDVADLYSIMDVFVLPSYREGFPRAPMEAAAMGVPAVVTDVRGCRETVEHDRTGYLVPVRDALALADAILELAGDPAKRTRFGVAARRKALAEFDEREVFARVIQRYASLIAARASF
jgi:glycosyltransferase involved in cell wall biosynthesis